MLDPKVKVKIQRKIMGMGIYRIIEGEKPRMTPSEFRYIIGRWGIKKGQWWNVLKEMEDDGIVKMPTHKRFIIILMDGAMVQKFVIEKH